MMIVVLIIRPGEQLWLACTNAGLHDVSLCILSGIHAHAWGSVHVHI